MKNKRVLSSYEAVEIAEGFGAGDNASEQERLEAWAVLIKSGLCWQLQGWFGRAAADLIENGVISKEGVIQ